MAFGLGLSSISYVPDCYPSRYCGICVRPVKAEKLTRVEEIVLSETSVLMQHWHLTPHTHTLVATVLPENASNKTLTWESSDEDVATVSQEGVITLPDKIPSPLNYPYKKSCTITCRASDGSGVTATCKVTVDYLDPE